MDQELTMLRSRIEKILNAELSGLLASNLGRGGGEPTSSADFAGAIHNPILRSKIEVAVSREVDDFFSKRRTEELFSSAATLAVPTGPATKLQRALVEECTRVLMGQIERRTSTFRSQLGSIPDSMLTRSWIERTFEGIFADVAKNSPTYLQGINMMAIFNEAIPEVLNSIKVSQAALDDLKGDLNREVMHALHLYASQLPPADKSPSPQSSISTPTQQRSSGSGKLRISMGKGESGGSRDDAERKLRVPQNLSKAVDDSFLKRISGDVTQELSAYLDAQLQVLKSEKPSYASAPYRPSPTIMPQPKFEQPMPVEKFVSGRRSTVSEYDAPYVEPLLEREPGSDEILASATPERPYFSTGTTGLVDSLVIHCTDTPIQQLLRSLLGSQFALTEGNYAKVVIPGGVQTLTLDEYLPKFSWATRKWIEFMSEIHTFERVICIAHDNCTWYQERRFNPYRPGGTKLSVAERQARDLRMAAGVLSEILPRAEIDLFLLSPGAKDKPQLDRIKLDQFSSST